MLSSKKTLTYSIFICLTALLTGCGGAENKLTFNNSNPNFNFDDPNSTPVSDTTNSKIATGPTGGNAPLVVSSIVENIKLISLPDDTDPDKQTPSLIGYLNNLLITLGQLRSLGGAWPSNNMYKKTCNTGPQSDPANDLLTIERIPGNSTQPETDTYQIDSVNCTFGSATVTGNLKITNPSSLDATYAMDSWLIQANIAINTLEIHYNGTMVRFTNKDMSTTNHISPPIRFTSQKNGRTGDIHASIQLQTSSNLDGFLTIMLPNGQIGSDWEINRILNESSTSLASFTSSYTASNDSQTLNIQAARLESFSGEGSRYGIFNDQPIQWLSGFNTPSSGTIKIIGGDKTSVSLKVIDTYGKGEVALFIYENNESLLTDTQTTTSYCKSVPLTWDDLPYIRTTSLCQTGGTNTNSIQNGAGQ